MEKKKTQSCWALTVGSLHFTRQTGFLEGAFSVQVPMKALCQVWHGLLLKYFSWVFLTSFQATVYSYKEQSLGMGQLKTERW